ncbi:flavin reductase family protein [bacterium]
MNVEALNLLSYGMYIVSSISDDKYNGQIANSVFQVAADPAILAISINKKNCTHEYIEKSKLFTVSILEEETPMTFIGKFGFRCGREFDKFEGTEHKLGVTGAPIVVENSAAYLEVEVSGSADAVTHTVFFGKIVNAEILKNVSPMTYAYYHHVKKGKSPSSAPTFIKTGNLLV